MSPITPELRREFAPTGTLRVGINLSNFLLTRTEPNGEHRGVAVDLGRELAARLGLPAEIVAYPNPGALADAAGADAAFWRFVDEQLEALAGLRPRLLTDQGKLPGSRILEGRFQAVQQAAGTPKGRPAAARYLRDFVEEAKASGLVAQLIERNNVRGLTVAPKG